MVKEVHISVDVTVAAQHLLAVRDKIAAASEFLNAIQVLVSDLENCSEFNDINAVEFLAELYDFYDEELAGAILPTVPVQRHD